MSQQPEQGGHPVGSQRLCIGPQMRCAWQMVEVISPAWTWCKFALFPEFVLEHLPPESLRGGTPVMSDGDEGQAVQIVTTAGQLYAVACRHLVKPEPDPLDAKTLSTLVPLTIAKGEPVA